jgi:uncharacterized CHY-type Zn-finger protein
MFADYSNTKDAVKEQARELAMRAREDILQLKCLHCNTAYFEFDGCVALQCGTCKGNDTQQLSCLLDTLRHCAGLTSLASWLAEHLCGYCHSKGKDSRNCDFNTTHNGSYYATDKEVKQAQQNMQMHALRKYIGTQKKGVHNALVVELATDMADLQIEPDRFFELDENLN